MLLSYSILFNYLSWKFSSKNMKNWFACYFFDSGEKHNKRMENSKIFFFLVFSRFQSSPQTSKKTDDLRYYSNQFSLYKQRVTVASIPHNIRKKEELYARLVCLLKESLEGNSNASATRSSKLCFLLLDSIWLTSATPLAMTVMNEQVKCEQNVSDTRKIYDDPSWVN